MHPFLKVNPWISDPDCLIGTTLAEDGLIIIIIIWDNDELC